MSDQQPTSSGYDKAVYLILTTFAVALATNAVDKAETAAIWKTCTYVFLAAVAAMFAIFWHVWKSFLSLKTLLSIRKGAKSWFGFGLSLGAAIFAIYNSYNILTRPSVQPVPIAPSVLHDSPPAATPDEPPSNLNLQLPAKSNEQALPHASSTPKANPAQGSIGVAPARPAKRAAPDREVTSASIAYLIGLCKDIAYSQCEERASPFIGTWVHIRGFVAGPPRFYKDVGFSVTVSQENTEYAYGDASLIFAQKYREKLIAFTHGSIIQALCKVIRISRTYVETENCEFEETK